MPPQLAGDRRNTREGGDGSRRRAPERRVAAFRAAAGLRVGISARHGTGTGHPCDQPAGKNEGHGSKEDHDGNHRKHKRPVTEAGRMFLVGVPFEQVHVPLVRFPAEVEQIAGKRNGTDDRIDRGIENHAAQHDLWNAHSPRLPQERGREQRRNQVTNPWNEPDDRVQSNAVRGAGQHERRIQQLGDTSQCDEPRLLTLRQRPQPNVLSYCFRPHRIRTAPTVKPAPTEARRSKSPSFNRFCSTASFSARGIVPPVVLPKRSMLMTTFSCGLPSFSVADRIIRRLAWWETKRSISHGLTPLRLRIARAASSVLRTANLNTVAPSCFT